MKKYLIIIIWVLMHSSCGNTKKGSGSGAGKDSSSVSGTTTIENIPSCLRQVIDKIGTKQYDYPPIQIDEYLYKGKKVYLHTADCCDQYNVVFDENCKGICSPSGGIDGRGDRKCNDFNDSAKLVRNIWKVKN